MLGGSKVAAMGTARGEVAWKSSRALLLVLKELSRAAPGLGRGWFQRLVQLEFEGGVLRVGVENEAQVEYLRRECGAALVAAAQAVTGRLVSIEFEVLAGACAAAKSPAFTRSKATLAGFVVGGGNRFAHASVLAALEEPGAVYNPLFVYGSAGTGKSHLLDGAAAVLREKLGAPVLHYTADSWTAELVKQYEEDTWEAFRRRVRSAGALILDDVQVLAERPRSLDELFHTINAFLGDQRQIVFAADRPPTELVGFPDRLIGRFGAGLVAGMDPPDAETRTAIVLARARAEAIEISDSVVKALVAEGPELMQELLALLVRLDAMSRMEAMPISAEMVRRAMVNS